MKKLLYILFRIAVLIFVVFLLWAHKSVDKYELIWEDHFNGTTFDDGSWSKIPRGTSPWNKFMSDADCLYDVKDGNLVLKGLENKDICPDDTAAYITIREGKYHQIKRMMAARGKPVTYLKRIKFGALTLDEQLDKGGWRALTDREIHSLFRQ